MKLLRTPLFFIGCVYGAVVNTLILGTTFAIIAMGWAFIKLADNCPDIITRPPFNYISAVPIIILVLSASIGGFIYGTVHGITYGMWSYGMEFYNHGIWQGLQAPFNFIPAIWDYIIHHDNTRLNAWNESTALNFFEKQARAKTAMVAKAEEIASICQTEIEKVIAENEESSNIDLDGKRDKQHLLLEPAISNLISVYSINSADDTGSLGRATEPLLQIEPEDEPPIPKYFSYDDAAAIVERKLHSKYTQRYRLFTPTTTDIHSITSVASKSTIKKYPTDVWRHHN